MPVHRSGSTPGTNVLLYTMHGKALATYDVSTLLSCRAGRAIVYASRAACAVGQLCGTHGRISLSTNKGKAGHRSPSTRMSIVHKQQEITYCAREHEEEGHRQT